MSESADRPQPGAGVPDWLGALAPVESAALSDGARVDALIGLQRVQAWASAQQYRLLAVMAEPGDPPTTR